MTAIAVIEGIIVIRRMDMPGDMGIRVLMDTEMDVASMWLDTATIAIK